MPPQGASGDVDSRLFFANNPFPMWIYDLETLRFLEVNDAAVLQYGLTRDEFLGMTILEIRPAEDLPRLRHDLAAGRPALQTSRAWRHRRKDGSLVDVNIVSHTLEFNGRAAVLVVAEDVTEQTRVEHDLSERLAREQSARLAAEEARRRLAFLAEATRLVTSLDERAMVTTVSGLAVPALADWCIVDLVDDQGDVNRVVSAHTDAAKVALVNDLERRRAPDARVPAGVSEVLRTGTAQTYPVLSDDALAELAWDDGHHRLLRALGIRSGMLVPLIVGDRAVGVLTLLFAESGREYSHTDLELAKDIAHQCAIAIERAALHRNVQALNADLERRVVERTAQLDAANKELESFSYSVAHDLRAPLRSIDGFSQALLEDYLNVLDAAGQRFLTRIRDASQRMGRLIDELLSLSRLTRAELRRGHVDLTRIAEHVISRLRQAHPKRSVEVTIAPDVTGDGDERLLEAALENLLGNAWKFTRDQANPRIEFGVQADRDPAVFFVRDNGAGFDMSYAHKLFGAFQRLHSTEEFEGTGIGLATVQRIIHRHGGRVWAEGAVGHGASFYFTLATEERS